MEELACCPKPGLGELCPKAEAVLLKLKGELEALLEKLNPVLALCCPKGCGVGVLPKGLELGVEKEAGVEPKLPPNPGSKYAAVR